MHCMQCMQRGKEPAGTPRVPPTYPAGNAGAHQSVDMEKGLTTIPLVTLCLRRSRLSESNRRPSHYERPGNVHPGMLHACDATHAMPETTPVAFRGYAGGKRMELNHAFSRFARPALVMYSFSACGSPGCKPLGPGNSASGCTAPTGSAKRRTTGSALSTRLRVIREGVSRGRRPRPRRAPVEPLVRR